MKFSKTVTQMALVSAGAGLAILGSVGSASAFNFSEAVNAPGGDASNTSATPTVIAAPTVYFPDTNTITGQLIGADTNDFYQFFLPPPGAVDGGINGFRSLGTGTPLIKLLDATGSLLFTGSAITGGSEILLSAGLTSGNYILQVTRSNLAVAVSQYTVTSTFSPVPEPFTMLGGAAALAVGGLMQKKRKQRQLMAQKAD
jgi:hypothetical protein